MVGLDGRVVSEAANVAAASGAQSVVQLLLGLVPHCIGLDAVFGGLEGNNRYEIFSVIFGLSLCALTCSRANQTFVDALIEPQSLMNIKP